MAEELRSAIEIRKGLASAPDELRLVQAFVNTLDVERGRDELESPRALANWLAARGLLAALTELDDADLERAVSLRSGLRSVIAARGKAPRQVRERLAQAVSPTTLWMTFPAAGGFRFEPAAAGLDAAIGRLLIISGIAWLDRRWLRLKLCADGSCAAVFWDRSSNRKALWCTPRCGNKAHARAHRRRERRKRR